MIRQANKRTYLDPIHQDIVLDREDPVEELIISLIDTKEFQRLRRVHQLGVSYFTFQGAEGSRFTHSVGVMSVASRLVDMVSDKTDVITEQRALILASALLHDIGHGPFSHCTEKILNYDHEDWSCRIISGETEVHAVLDKYDPSLAGKIVSVLKKKYSPKFVSHLVSSQLDCDRFDYLLRDSYMTGTAYGLFALHRILRSMEIDEEQDRIIVVGEKGQTAVEDYLFARYSMYAQVYYHKKNLAARALLAKLINRARELMRNGQAISFIDAPTRRWLMGEQLSVDEYLSVDDVQLNYHIKRWQDDPDKILCDLASRFLNRRLFKAVKISLAAASRPVKNAVEHGGQNEAAADGNGRNAPYLVLEQYKEIEDQARKAVREAGYDPDYYVALESTGFRPYDYYRPDAEIPQTNIVVRTDNGEVKELSQLSLTVEALVKGNYESHWLVYPAECDERILQIKGLTPVH
jgi:HD superfamily phosphohydrolase